MLTPEQRKAVCQSALKQMRPISVINADLDRTAKMAQMLTIRHTKNGTFPERRITP